MLTLDVSGFSISGTPYTLATYSGFTGDLSALTLTGASDDIRVSLANTGNELQLTVSRMGTTLIWKAGAKGVWQADSDLVWGFVSGITTDNRFHDGNTVLFDTKATVTLSGNVSPDSTIVRVMGKDSLTFSGKGAISGTGTLTMDGTGTLKMNASNTYSGGTFVRSGTVTATGVKSFGTGIISLSGGTLNLGGKAIDNDINATGGILSGAGKYTGSLSVNGGLELKGTALAGSISIASGATLTGGTVKDTAVTLNGGTLASVLSGKSVLTVAGNSIVNTSLSQTGATNVLDEATLTFGQSGVKTNMTIAAKGSISGDGSLAMDGAGTLKLNATNTYTGGTFINSGTVTATGVASFGTGNITLSGGTLNLGKKAIKNNITVTDNATILNAKGFAGVITVQGGTLSLTDSLTGTLVLNGGTLDLSGVKSIAKMTFGNVVCEAETEIVDAKGQHYAFVDGKLVPTDRTVAAVPVPQHAELPGAGLYTTMMRAQMDGNRAAFDSIRQLMGTGEPSSADGRYRFAEQATSASTDMKDYRRQGFGGLVMVEEVFSRKAVGGLSLNYEHADINPDGAGKYESDDTRVNAHLLVSTKNWQSRSIAGIGIHDYDVNRSSATGHSFNLMEEISRTIAVDDRSVVAPFVRVETGYNVIGSINDGVLAIDKQTAWSTDVTLGARYVKNCNFGTVMLEAGVTKAIGDQGGAIGASLVDAPATRAALSPSSRNRWSATLGGSVQVPVGERSAIQAGATLRLHGGTTEVNANVGYSIKF